MAGAAALQKAVGGARAGAGRKPAYMRNNKVSVASTILKDTGKKPLNVLIENMRKYDARSHKEAAKLDNLIKKFVDGEMANLTIPEICAKFREALHAEIHWDQLANKAAVEAAPYLHAKLQTVELNVNDDRVDDKSDEELAAELKESAEQIALPEVAGHLLQLTESISEEASVE